MQLSALETNTLDVEDFRRLGVRPQECRSLVIRQAAARRSRSLARLQLTSPTPNTELQLSRIATSAYRLLDPRKRVDFLQRVRVGRVLATSFPWGNQGQFRVDSADAAAANGEATEPYSSRDEEPFFFEVEYTQAYADNLEDRVAFSNWVQSLDSEDLILAAPRRHRIATLRRSIQHPRMILALIGLVLVTLYGVSQLDFRPETIAIRRVESEPSLTENETETEMETDTEPTVLSPSAQGTNQTEPSSTSGPAESGPADEQVASVDPPSQTGPSLPKNPMATSEVTPASPEIAEQPLMAPLAPKTASPPALPPAAAVEEMESQLTDSAPVLADTQLALTDESKLTEESGFLPDPFAAVAMNEIGTARSPDHADIPRTADKQPDAPVIEVERADLKTLLPEPSESEQNRAIARWKLAIPQIGTPLTPSQIPRVIQQIETSVASLSDADVDAYVAHRLIAQYAWLIETPDQVNARLQRLPPLFAVSIDRLLTQAYLAAENNADMLETQQHLARNGLVLAEHHLTFERFEDCENVLAVATRLATTSANRERILDVQQLTQALEQAQRMQTTVSRLDLTNPDAESPSDLGVAGRYYCLMLRRWDEGLPWLVHASDTRLANLARQEMEMTNASTATDWNELADRWILAADRSDGRSADSLRYHVIALKRRAAGLSNGFEEKLNRDREIEQAESALPFYLRQASDGQSLGHESPASQPAATDASEIPLLEPATADESTPLSGSPNIAGVLAAVELASLN
ncbi:hypothetical protein [Novipirellula artificiosorum]|uniref:Uncharacterized protein n=1 Tax=Novipirellula artificiosorum TaxID=2528016 RepID=A0A5C6E444_9BACT|nr:hypothetical protein [Novipirellula artificiosorum]TWU41989.1 hypothetical protein Poly41_02850 [Novipirellula artificiosorum]